MNCCICNKPLEESGHNPEPLKDGTKYKCCKDCNCRYVIPARVIVFRRDRILKEIKKVW